uniref:Secreted protein n=1 Tax=Trichogramma kaykai TaxID=54128 RepID=A0ABD2XFA3_9HYME
MAAKACICINVCMCAIYNTCSTRPRAAAATTPESDERDNIGEQLCVQYTLYISVYRAMEAERGVWSNARAQPAPSRANASFGNLEASINLSRLIIRDYRRTLFFFRYTIAHASARIV